MLKPPGLWHSVLAAPGDNTPCLSAPGGGGLHQGLWEREEQGWASFLWACFPWAKAGGRACAAAPSPPEGRERSPRPTTGLSACERPGLVGEALGLREEKPLVRLTTVPSLKPWKGVLGLWPGGGRALNPAGWGWGAGAGQEGKGVPGTAWCHPK